MRLILTGSGIFFIYINKKVEMKTDELRVKLRQLEKQQNKPGQKRRKHIEREN